MSNHGTAKEEIGGIKDRVVGSAKDTAGELTGNTSLEREGEAQNAYGNARQANNDVIDTDYGQGRVMTGMFRDRDSAERAYNSITNRGYNSDDVNVLMSDQTRDKYFTDDDTALGTKALEGAGVGGAVGGTLGAVLAGIAAIGTNLVLPGLGLLVAGPLAAAFAGAGAGGLTGGLIGALIGSGIPEEQAKYYEQGIKDGGIVMGVNPRTKEDADYFENEWRNYKGEQIYR